MWYILALVLCVAADQAVKFWTVAHLGLYETAPLIPGVVELMYVQNTGGGFSILAGHTWLLTAVTALAMWTLTAILGGGLGNLVDRVRLGYVVDMFNFQFMNYPVFNVADILVVCGVIGFAAYYLLLHDKVTGKKEKDHDGAADRS